MNDIEQLLAIEQIRRLKARYFRCVDTKDWQGFADLFASDARFDISSDVPGGMLVGPAAIVQTASDGLRGAVSVHLGHSPEIDITSDTSARAVWAMEDLIRWDDAAQTPLESMHGYGHYHETYQRLDGRWYIKTLRLTRLRLDLVPRPG